MGTKAKWKSGKMAFYDGVETVLPVSPIVFYDDFLGAYLEKWITGENTTARWKTTETVGSVALLANEPNGVVSNALTNADSAQIAALHWGDQLGLSLKRGLIFETRLCFNVLPTTGTETVQAVFGLASAHNATLNSVATNVWFRVESSAQTALLWETDDGNTDTDDQAISGVTLVADTYKTFQIDCRDLANGIKFYVDGALVGTSPDMLTNLTDTEAKVQPYFNVSKAKSAANTGTGTMYIDYCRVYQNRS